jgi:hypothetical protein
VVWPRGAYETFLFPAGFFTFDEPQRTTDPGGSIAQVPDEEGWISLFNGVNLAGWTIRSTRPNNNDWRVVDGILVGRGEQGESYLYHDRSDWKDFELLVECRINDRGNSGIFFRCPLSNTLPPGYEAHIDVWNCGRFHRTGLSGRDGIDPNPQVKIAPGTVVQI